MKHIKLISIFLKLINFLKMILFKKKKKNGFQNYFESCNTF